MQRVGRQLAPCVAHPLCVLSTPVISCTCATCIDCMASQPTDHHEPTCTCRRRYGSLKYPEVSRSFEKDRQTRYMPSENAPIGGWPRAPPFGRGDELLTRRTRRGAAIHREIGAANGGLAHSSSCPASSRQRQPPSPESAHGGRRARSESSSGENARSSAHATPVIAVSLRGMYARTPHNDARRPAQRPSADGTNAAFVACAGRITQARRDLPAFIVQP